MFSALPRIAGLSTLAAAFLCLGGTPPAPAQDGNSAQDTGFIWYAGREAVPDDWFVSNFVIQRPQFRTAWGRTNTRIRDGALELLLRPVRADNRAERSTGKDFIGAEVQRQPKTLYGRYEVEMTAARGEGVISSFFTYTGPYFNDPHDEIDFEFLGRDTTKVWLNRFVDGEKLPGQWIDLGFDAADGPHLYAFEWTAEELVWYVDGRELLRVTAEETALPVTPSKIYINIWAGGELQEMWSGNAPDDTYAVARYYCLSFQPVGADTQQCSDRGSQ